MTISTANLDSGTDSPRAARADLLAAVQKLNLIVSVRDFGAVGDGATDDSAAIQLAVERVRSMASSVSGWSTSVDIVFPPGVYVVNSGIDMTAIRSLGVTVSGWGATVHGKCAGKPVFDALHSRYIFWRGLTIVGDATSTPKYGVQIGRKDSTVADENGLDSVSIVGTFSGAAFYNHGSETCQFRHCRFYNDSPSASAYALIMDGSNSWGASSDFVTVTSAANTNVSFNENTFVGCDIRRQTTGKAIVYSGAPSRHSFIGCYAVSVDDWVVHFHRVSGISQMTLDMHTETTAALGLLLIDNVNPASAVFLRGLQIRDHNPQGSVAIIDTTGTTRQVIFDGADWEFAGVPTGVPLVGSTSGASSNMIVSGVIRWEDVDTLTLTNCRFTGQIYTETSTPIAHTLGTYEVIRRPNSADSRALDIKGETRFSGTRDGTDASNYVSVTGAGASGVPEIKVEGTDTNLDIRLTPKGTGRVRFGTLTANADAAVTGYIEIKDAAGTVRKLAVIA